MPCSTCALPAVMLCAVLAIAGCGGGGGSSTTTPPPTGSSNPVPTVTSVTPSSGTAGDGATPITVAGSNFVLSSAVQWNGTALSTWTFEPSVFASMIAVSLPSGLGGGASNAICVPSGENATELTPAV